MKLLKKHIIKTLFLHRFRKNNLFLITLCNMTHEASPYHRGTAGLCADFSSRFFSQSTTRWTVWCRRPSSASSWRRSDITLCSSLRTNGESVSSNESPSASLWLQRASAVSWEFSWSLRCSQGSFKIGSWGKPGLKVGEGGHLWMFFVSSLWLLTPDSQFPPKSPGLTLTSSGRDSFTFCHHITEFFLAEQERIASWNTEISHHFSLGLTFNSSVDRPVWAEGGTIFGGAARHRAKWSKQVP